MLEVDRLRVDFGRAVAVMDVSLEVRPGETVALIGPNGAGKSTTLNAIAGVHKPSQGRLSFLGETLVGATPEEIARRGVAMVPEGRRIFATLSVAENLGLGLVARRGRGGAEEIIEAQLERFPILRRYYQTAAGLLSGGEQQQLAIARALASEPRLLLLDEPSLGLAPKLIDQVFEILEELREDGITMLLVEQNAHRSIALADRTYALSNGEVVISGTRKELQEMELSDVYLGSEDTVAP